MTIVNCETQMLYQIGIYSNCTGIERQRTELSDEAEVVSDFNKYMIDRDYQSIKTNNETIGYDFAYEEYDVCENITFLTEIVQNLILNESYNFQAENETYLTSSIIGIFMHTSVEMASLVKSIFTLIPVYDYDYRTQKDGSIYDITDEAAEALVLLIKHIRLKKITLIALTTVDLPFLVYYRKSVEALQELNICLELYHIEPHQVNKEVDFLKRMSDSNEMQFIVVYGNEYDEKTFFQRVSIFFPVLPVIPIFHYAPFTYDSYYIKRERSLRRL